MLMRLIEAFRRSAATPRPTAPPRAAAAGVDAGSRRRLVRAASPEWRAHCAAVPAARSLDGGLDRTAVRVWRDGARTVQAMGR
jgi:hypothetical protein